MRDSKPGDLTIRMGFARMMGMMGTGPDAMSVRPSIQITDGTSSKQLTIELTPQLLTEMLAGGEARVTADKVSGFGGLQDFGKYHQMAARYVPVQNGDVSRKKGEEIDPRTLPHVAAVLKELEADGFTCDFPRRNNQAKWVIIGRKYTAKP
jgi:hypothetical protein